eukprot:TRINITY_DN66866_c0_g1_i1.p1 TRINITY_DN66866_c0_g1~~TRINITY_DN66866_c0_g1_i1.p1  ORF type:complete len:409 (+),score=118.87 TRINITY_DN66866_c0_g1_i1:141-1367(+)
MAKLLRHASLRRWVSSAPNPGTTDTKMEFPRLDENGIDRFYAGSGTNIAGEEPMFGNFGYKPPPPMSRDQYSLSDNFNIVQTTTTKGVRQPASQKKVLPPPATKVAIFGATGFQGSRIAKRLVEAPEIEEVRLCTRYPDEIPPDLQKVIELNPEKCTVEETHVNVLPSVNKALQGCNAVINAIDMRNEDFYNLHVDVHVQGMQNIAYQARMCGIKRVVYISGLDAIMQNDSDYSDFRAKAEDMALAECFFGAVLRPGKLYGSGYRYSSLGKFFYPTVHSDTKLQPTWANDLAEATFRVIRDPNAVKRVIELGGPKVMTHMQFASERAAYLKGPSPFPLPIWIANITAFFSELVNARPHFTGNMICEMEQHQVARTKEENPYLWSWEDLGMTPSTMQEAAAREAKGESF